MWTTQEATEDPQGAVMVCRWQCPENVRDVLGQVQLCNQRESWDRSEKPIPLAEG